MTLYSGKDKTLLETIAPGLIRPDGQKLTEEHLAFLGKLVGTTQSGNPVEKVAVVFFMEEEAQAFLDPCKRYGVECRAMQMSTGQEVVLVEGSRVQQGPAVKGVLLPVFREASWPGLETVVHRPLFHHQPEIKGPWVTFAEDVGTQLARLPPSELKKRSLQEIEEEALANLAKRTFKPELKDTGAVLLLEEYAPESLLLSSVRQQIIELLGSPLFLAAAGKEGTVIAAQPDPNNPGIIQVAEMMFRDAKGRRISPMPFICDANGIIGFAGFSPPKEAPKEKPWWKFW